MDLLKHLESLETFGGRAGDRLVSKPGGPGQVVRPVSAVGSPSSARAAAFLERIGAAPKEAEPIARFGEQFHNDQHFAPPAIRFRSIEHRKLEETLCGLKSFNALTELLDEGVRVGALSVVGDRVQVLSDAGPDRGDAPSTAGRFDITDQVERAAMALKARDSVNLLQHIAPPVPQPGGPVGEATLPQLVRLRRQEGRGQPGLIDIPPESTSSLRGRLREFFRRHPVVASLDELGADTTFRVAGAPVRTASGQYVPLEVIREEARATLLERLQQHDPGRRAPVAWARLDELREMSLPDYFMNPGPGADPLAPDNLPSAGRIELAYRLVKGLSLSDEEGEPIEHSTRTRLEHMLGSSFTHVRLHTGPASKFITESLEARALTYGQHVFIPRERLSSTDPRDQQTLAHELVHVQQHDRGDLQDRASREAEAERVERAVDTQNFTLPRAIRPELEPGQFIPQRFEPQAPDGVFMAKMGDEPAAKSSAGSTKKLELREEPVIAMIEDRMVEERTREKEDMRDRVF